MRNRRRGECKGYGNKCGKGQGSGEKCVGVRVGGICETFGDGRGNGGKRGRRRRTCGKTREGRNEEEERSEVIGYRGMRKEQVKTNLLKRNQEVWEQGGRIRE